MKKLSISQPIQVSEKEMTFSCCFYASTHTLKTEKLGRKLKKSRLQKMLVFKCICLDFKAKKR